MNEARARVENAMSQTSAGLEAMEIRRSPQRTDKRSNAAIDPPQYYEAVPSSVGLTPAMRARQALSRSTNLTKTILAQPHAEPPALTETASESPPQAEPEHPPTASVSSPTPDPISSSSKQEAMLVEATVLPDSPQPGSGIALVEASVVRVDQSHDRVGSNPADRLEALEAAITCLQTTAQVDDEPPTAAGQVRSVALESAPACGACSPRATGPLSPTTAATRVQGGLVGLEVRRLQRRLDATMATRLQSAVVGGAVRRRTGRGWHEL